MNTHTDPTDTTPEGGFLSDAVHQIPDTMLAELIVVHRQRTPSPDMHVARVGAALYAEVIERVRTRNAIVDRLLSAHLRTTARAASPAYIKEAEDDLNRYRQQIINEFVTRHTGNTEVSHGV